MDDAGRAADGRERPQVRKKSTKNHEKMHIWAKVIPLKFLNKLVLSTPSPNATPSWQPTQLVRIVQVEIGNQLIV